MFSMIIQNKTISVALTCTQEQICKKAHKILISQIALKLQLYAWPGGGPEGPGPPNRNATNDKNVTKKSCLLIFSCF